MDKHVSTPPTFAVGDRVLHSAHGIGVITHIQDQEYAGVTATYITVRFNERTSIHVPLRQASLQLERLSVDIDFISIFTVLKEESRKRKGRSNPNRFFSACADKINSGDLRKIAEVIRDTALRNDEEISATQREYYLAACQRLVDMYAEVNGISPGEAILCIHDEISEGNLKIEYATERINVASAPKKQHVQSTASDSGPPDRSPR